jgi:hypothetical protein
VLKYNERFWEINMTKTIRRLASNIDINGGSILLLFDERDVAIARNWQHPAKSDDAVDRRDAPST